jgi:hypothetical protein
MKINECNSSIITVESHPLLAGKTGMENRFDFEKDFREGINECNSSIITVESHPLLAVKTGMENRFDFEKDFREGINEKLQGRLERKIVLTSKRLEVREKRKTSRK